MTAPSRCRLITTAAVRSGTGQHRVSAWAHSAVMNKTPKLSHILSICAVVAFGGLASCGVVAGHISSEAARELADEVRDDVMKATSTTDQSPASYVVLNSALHGVVDREQSTQDPDSSFNPRFTGLLDADQDGVDDDGRVEIVVRRASACIIATVDDVTVHDGPC